VAIDTTPITEKFVTLTHGKTRYFEAGSGYPTILIHGAGFLGGADTLLPVMPHLAEQLHVYTIDCLNWGPGDVFNQELSFAYLVDHVREFMDAMGIEKANLAGHSMGGWICTLFAYESPNRLNKVVLSSAGGTATRPLQSMVEFTGPTEEAVRTQVTRRLENAPAGIDRDALLNEYLQFALDPVHVEAFAKVMRHMTNNETRVRYNTLRRLPHITTPTLILWGTNDQTNDISMGHDLHNGIKGSKFVTFEGAGHGTPGERTADWAREVRDFFTS
jgi:2-hydroxy-6-oxonona-2,4-dienedioate hydrolase